MFASHALKTENFVSFGSRFVSSTFEDMYESFLDNIPTGFIPNHHKQHQISLDDDLLPS